MNHTIMAISVFTAIASLLAAANLYSTHAYASVLTHPIRSHFSLEGLQTKSGHKSQHLNQENLCYRTVICNNSNVALQTLGNDNSVTGFADQSGNFQQTPDAGTGQKAGSNFQQTPDAGTGQKAGSNFQQTPAANMITGAGSGFTTNQLR
jgi:hypothetical protein